MATNGSAPARVVDIVGFSSRFPGSDGLHQAGPGPHGGLAGLAMIPYRPIRAIGGRGERRPARKAGHLGRVQPLKGRAGWAAREIRSCSPRGRRAAFYLADLFSKDGHPPTTRSNRKDGSQIGPWGWPCPARHHSGRGGGVEDRSASRRVEGEGYCRRRAIRLCGAPLARRRPARHRYSRLGSICRSAAERAGRRQVLWWKFLSGPKAGRGP